VTGTNFVFDQPDVLLTAELNLAEKLNDFTDIEDDGYIRGVITSDADGLCRSADPENHPYCVSIYGGYSPKPTFIFEFHNKFNKANIVAIDKMPGGEGEHTFHFNSREEVKKITFDSRSYGARQISSTFVITRSNNLKYIGGNANDAVTISSSNSPLIDNAKIKAIDLEFGDGENHLSFDNFQGPNKEIKKLTASFGEGDDLIDFNSGSIDPVFFSKKIQLKTGSGDDKLNMYQNGGLLAGKKIKIDLGNGADGINFGLAANVASQVKSVKIILGKDDDRDFARIFVPKSFDQSLITFKNVREEDSVDIWTWGQDDPRGEVFS